MDIEEKEEIESAPKDKFLNVVCFNCGDVGHYSTTCRKTGCCFICHKEDHVVDQCPEWKKEQAAAQFYGSARRGLGFFHIDVEPREGRFKHWRGLDNYGIITLEQGDIIEEATVVQHLRNLFDDKWDWQLRQEDEYSYVMRFSPHKKVEDLVVGQATLFYLKGTNVLASLKAWNGDVEPIGHLEEVWVQIKGIPPKWADWWTIKDVASSLGLLAEVDWTTLFSTFFSTARVKIKCKDPVKIPKERVYEMGGSCFLVTCTAEGFEQIDDLSGDNDGKGDEGKWDDGKGDEGKGNGNGNVDKGDDIDPDEDDLLGDDSEEDINQDKGNTKGDGGSKHKEQSASKKVYQSSASSPKNDGVRDKSVRRPLTFLEDFHELSLENASGFELLKAMELEGSDEEDT